MIKYIELPIKEYIQEVIKKGKLGIKVYIKGEKNAPVFKKRYDLYLADGFLFSFISWSQFIGSIYQLSCKGVTIDYNKTWDAFEKQNPQDLNRTIIVDYYEHRSTVQQYLDSLEAQKEPQKFSLAVVMENQKGKKALIFKSWLEKYLKGCDDVEYSLDYDKGVFKILKELQDLEKNK